MADEFTIFTGTANSRLAENVAREVGVPLGAVAVERFPDGEISVRLEEPARGREVFIIQPTSPPVDGRLIELLAFADACRRASAAHVTAVIPYFGYARSDKRHGRREPIMASMVAGLIQEVGINHVVTIDLHAPQVEGFFHIPVDSLTATETLCRHLSGRLQPEVVVVSPDVGRVKMASAFAQRLGAPVVVLQKRRESGTEAEITHVVGDVRDRACLIVDDIISTGGTVAKSVEALLKAGARNEISVAATHGLFLDGAKENLSRAGIREVIVTDTVARSDEPWLELRVVSVAPLLAAAIRRFMADGSLGDLR